MPSALGILSALAHLQIVMALSAVAYVQTAALLLTGRGAPSSWLLAALFGTLGIYLLDGVRSADREDSISQANRARLSRRFRGWLSALGLLSLLAAGVFVLRSEPSVRVLILLGLLGFVSLAHVLPLIPGRSGLVTTKDLGLVKPLVISLAWLIGGLLVSFESDPEEPLAASAGLAGFALMTFPLLVLDSFWLDRRDMQADARFDRGTFAGGLESDRFRSLCGVFFLLPLLGAPWLPGGWVMIGWYWLGAVWLVLLPPRRLHAEAVQVCLAALWRFTGLIGALVLVTAGR
jgi:hypothetical protein